MTQLVTSDQFEPIVDAEHAKKRMRKAVACEISGSRFVKKRESSVANSAEFTELSVFFAEESLVNGKWSAKTGSAVFGEENGKAEALEERNRARLMANDAI